MRVEKFVIAWLPEPPARVLEVGCGRGELAANLSRAGYDVVAIDPEAPDGPIFRRTSLEEFPDAGPFAAIVASRALHHVTNLAGALDKMAALLSPGGLVILAEFGWDRLDEPTAEWYFGRRVALAAARGGSPGAPRSLEACVEAWHSEHEGLHGYAAMGRELGRRFEQRHFSWEPYLYHELDGVVTEPLERALIEARAIQATGFRYVGARR